MKREIALALGGGGAKGHAHIGVLRVLEEAGYTVRAVAGTSAGSIVGALYAAGYNPLEIEEWVKSVDQRHFFDRSSGDRPSILGLHGLRTMLESALGERDIRSFSIPFGAVSVDILSGKTIFMTSGSAVEAVLASSAVPGIFPPLKKGNWLLVDGGTTDNVPVRLARLLAPGVPVVAVSLTTMPSVVPCFSGLKPPFQVPGLLKIAGRLRYTQALKIALRAVDIALSEATLLRLAVDRPEVLITPDVAEIDILDTDVPVEKVAALGEEAARHALKDIERLFSPLGRLRRRPPKPELRDVVVV